MKRLITSLLAFSLTSLALRAHEAGAEMATAANNFLAALTPEEKAKAVFDFANPDMLAPQRFATSVPQQGLFLINHPFVLERARALAARTGPVAGTSVESRIRQLYRYVLQRSPSATELRSSQRFIESELSQEAAVGGLPSSTGQDQGSAGTLKAWEQFAQVLLLSNEFLFID